MSRRSGRTVEVDTLEEFDELVGRGATHLGGWRLQGLDLTGRTAQLRSLDPEASLFLGCQLDEAATSWVRRRGGLIFPAIPQLAFDPYRTALYTPEELFHGIESSEYEATPDARIYAWSRELDRSVTRSLAQTLHDHAVDEALREALAGQPAVGVMGGHAVTRDDAAYASAAELGRQLSRRGLLVVTGGGPGAMEAANLGAYLAGEPDPVLDEALGILRRVPSFTPSVTQWARTAFEVRSGWPAGRPSLGVPTWFYGHEPPNPFATGVAKYFANALREDVLVRTCTAGIIFLPGSAGTVQEIFQDACENYYADDATLAPMVLVGRDHWTRDVPAWPLLESLARGRPMEDALHLVDSVDEATALVSG